MADDEIDLSAGYAKAPAPAGGMDLSAGFVRDQDKLDLSAGFQASKPQQAAPQPTPSQPQDYIHAGPATPSPRVPEEGKQSTGDWLLDALLGPNTLIGHLLHPTKEPSKQENVESKMSGMPVMGQRPLIDPSVGIEEPFTKGMVQSLGGLTAPAQLPFMAAPASKAISAIFAATTVPQLMDHYQRYDQYKKEGNTTAANAELGSMTSTLVMGSMAAYHAGSIEGGVPPQRFNLTPDELKYTTNLIQQHLESSAAAGDHAGVEDAVHGLAAILPELEKEHGKVTTEQATAHLQEREGGPAPGPVHTPSPETIQPIEAQGAREENLRLDQPASRGGGPVEVPPGAGAVQEGAGREASEGKLTVANKASAWVTGGHTPLPAEAAFIQRAVDWLQERFPQASNLVKEVQLVDNVGPLGSLTDASYSPSDGTIKIGKGWMDANVGVSGEDAALVRLKGLLAHELIHAEQDQAGTMAQFPSGARELEGPAMDMQNLIRRELRQQAEASEGELAARLGELHSILPDFQRIIGGEEEAAPPPVEGHGAEVEEQPPVISRATDDDMAAGGVHVIPRGKDINWGVRALGSLIQKAQSMVRDGHPLGQVVYNFTSIGSDAIKAIAANSMDTMKVFINDAKKLVNREEWSEQVARLMDQGVTEQPAGVPDHVWKATQAGQALVEAGRIKLIAAKRAELHDMRPSLPADKIIEFYPDDWGKKGAYYPHAHPGTWTITEHTGVDERGNDIWEPIDSPTTSWRALSEFQAKAVAEGWLKDHPDATIRVRQDTVTAAANSLTDRARLMALTDRVREATTTITHGGDPEEVMDQLYNQSAAAAYGPRSATKRQFGATMRRETNLEGYTRDIDDFKDHLLATERYAVLAPVRQKMMKIRNFVADLAGAKQVQSPSDLPTLKFPPQYANLLGRMDSFIEGLEGTPGLSDAATKYILNGLGLDPNLANKAMGPVQQLWATMKLGMNPARVLSHGLQSLWAVNTVIGEKATFQGYVHGYDPKYEWLIHDLGIEHAGNMSDLEGMRTYAGAYFGRGSTPIDWSKGTLKIARDIGLSPLTMGINFSSHTAAVGAYIQGLERGMEPAQARNYARDVLDRTMGVYHAADNPALLRQLPSTVTQFKPFMMKTGQFILNLRGAEIPRFMAAAVLLGGVSAPIISQLSSLVHLATGGDTIADYLKRKYPKLARGIFGYLGLDVPSAVGPGDFSLYRTNAPMGGVAGPLGSDILAGAKAGVERFQGPSRQAEQDLDSFIRGLSPQGRRMWDFGVRMATKPQTIDPRTGSKILGDVTTREQLELLMGFTPLRMAEERESHEFIRNQLEEAKDKRGFFVDKLAENQLELMRPQITDSQRADLLKETIDLQRLAVEYNQGNKLIPAVRERLKEMLQDRLNRDLKHAPKPMRPEIYNEMMRFKQENQ